MLRGTVTMGKTAILLHNLGGPRGDEEVRPFLERIFSDPEAIRLPLSRWLQKPFARFLAKRRAPVAIANYRRIGGSPLLEWTESQARGLALGLKEHLPDEELEVLPAMRYWQPTVEEALAAARDFGATRILSFPLYPQYSMATTASSEAELDRCLARMDWAPSVVRIRSWHDCRDFHECWAWRIRRALRKIPAEQRSDTMLLFSAHGIPYSFVKRGDPYVDQIRQTADGILRCLDSEQPHALAFQSRAGPVRWTPPYLDMLLREQGQKGLCSVCLIPISFVSDHVETLFELDIEMKQTAEQAGIQHFCRCESLNADPDFLAVLTRLAAEALNEVRVS